MKRKKPVGVWCIDLGPNAKCLVCKNRYCTCRERRDGTWENTLIAKKMVLMKKYTVDLYYSTYFSVQIEAKSEGQAIIKARKKYRYDVSKGDELLSNLEEFLNADEAEEIEESK